VIVRTQLRADVSDVAPPGCRTLAVEVVAAAAHAEGIGADSPVVFCFPGGGMSRRYFDLAVPGYSFAEYVGGRGFVTVLVDHPGVGDSDAPDDGWTLTPQTVARVDAAAVSWVLAALRSGAVAGIPALRPSLVLGVAHSAGALVLIHHQAEYPQFDGVVLLGWGGHGLPEHLDDSELALGSDPDLLVSRLVDGAKKRHDKALTVLPRGSSRMLVAAEMPGDVHQALVDARSRLLAVVGYASLMPGSASRAAARIDVPVFLGVGENDIAVNHHQIPAEFPSSFDVTLFVLEAAGHNQNVEPNREQLWARVVGWAADLARRLDAEPGRALGGPPLLP
jgi:pimeloyl-ACP methyl ester carboxylesterase